MAGRYIRYYRTKAGLTQEQLAIKANISQSHLSDIETCKKSPTVRVLYSIAKALDVCPGVLLEYKCNCCCKKKSRL